MTPRRVLLTVGGTVLAALALALYGYGKALQAAQRMHEWECSDG